MSVNDRNAGIKRKIDYLDDDSTSVDTNQYYRKKRSTGIQQLRLIPDPLKTGCLYLNDLSDDVLLMIFEQLGLRCNLKNRKLDGTPKNFENDKEICAVSAVCHRWKQLIDRHHIFVKLNFFGKRRTKEEYENMLQSQRRYYDLKFCVQRNAAETQMECFQKFLPTQTHLLKIHITLKDLEQEKLSCDLRNWLENFPDADLYVKMKSIYFWIKQNGIYWDSNLNVVTLRRKLNQQRCYRLFIRSVLSFLDV